MHFLIVKQLCGVPFKNVLIYEDNNNIIRVNRTRFTQFIANSVSDLLRIQSVIKLIVIWFELWCSTKIVVTV